KVDCARGLSSGLSSRRVQSSCRRRTRTNVAGATSTFVRRRSSAASGINSDLHDDRHDDGARAGLLLYEALEFDADALFEERRVAALLARGGLDCLGDDALHVAHECGRAFAVESEQTARDDFRFGFQ